MRLCACNHERLGRKRRAILPRARDNDALNIQPRNTAGEFATRLFETRSRVRHSFAAVGELVEYLSRSVDH